MIIVILLATKVLAAVAGGVDNVDPTITNVPSSKSVNNGVGQAGAVVSWTDPTVMDNSGSVTLTASETKGSFFPIGPTTVTFTATDGAGNSVEDTSFIITVVDIEDPTLINIPSPIAVNTDPGLAIAVVSWTDPTANDNAPGAIIEISLEYTPGPGGGMETGSETNGGSFPIGTTTITFVATDGSGNSVEDSSFTITVTDNENPTLIGIPSPIAVDSDPGNAYAVVSFTYPTASDNAPGVTISDSEYITPLGLLTTLSETRSYYIGITTVTFVATDDSGNLVMDSTFTITVSDNEDPTIIGLPSPITVNNDPGLASAVVSWTDPTANDNSEVAKITQSQVYNPGPGGMETGNEVNGGSFPIGTVTVTFTATDYYGNSVEDSSFTVTVNDNESPSLTSVPSPVTVNNDPGLASAVVSWIYPTVIDNTSEVDISELETNYIPGPGATGSETSGYGLGTVTFTFVATDGSGNSVEDSTFTITVIDNEPPTFTSVPPPVTVSNDPGLASAVVSWTYPTVTDNASGVDISEETNYIPGPGATGSETSGFGLGTTTFTFVATDPAGNSVEDSTFTITVIDDEAPTITDIPPSMTVSNDPGLASAVVSWTDPTVMDNSGSVTLTASEINGDNFPLGTTTVIFTATDGADNSGEDSSFMITVVDVEAPVIIGVPSSITVGNDLGLTSATVVWTDPTVIDTSPEVLLTASEASGGSFPIGRTTVTFTATDGADNSVEDSSFIITVVDDEDPTITSVPPSMTVSNDPGLPSAVVSWTDPTAIDNAPGVVIEGRYTNIGSFPLGTTMVSFTATDTTGNSVVDSSFVITVIDAEDPTFTSVPSSVSVGNDPGLASAVVSWRDPTAFDNAPGVIVTKSETNGGSFPLGTTKVTFTAVDAVGNSVVDSSFIITVIDAEDPIITIVPSSMSVNTDSGSTNAIVSWTDPTVMDNSGSVTLTASETNGGSFPIGTTTVTFTATDNAGNSVTDSTFVITVTGFSGGEIAGIVFGLTGFLLILTTLAVSYLYVRRAEKKQMLVQAPRQLIPNLNTLDLASYPYSVQRRDLSFFAQDYQDTRF